MRSDGDSRRDDDARALGPELASTYYALWNELAWIHMKWNEFVELFGTKPSRVDLLNRAAGGFFRIVQDTLFADVLLHLCRLTDPVRSMGKENLTIHRLPSLIVDESLRTQLLELINDATIRTAFCRDWRNRYLAHTDLRLALDAGAEPLAPASRTAVRESLDSLSEVLNAISTRLLNSQTAFDYGGAEHGAASLLRYR